ncbi:MAG: hypothetical protein ACRYGG_06895, partial [Janthinobacterium lividum]
MRNYFIPQDIFALVSALTAFSSLPEELRLIAPMHVEGRHGMVVNERQFAILFPSGTDGYTVMNSTLIQGLSIVVEADAETPAAEDSGVRTRTRRVPAQPVQADLPLAPAEVLTDGQRLDKACADVCSTFADLGAMAFASTPFESCRPRTTGTDIRLIWAAPQVNNFQTQSVNTHSIPSLEPYTGRIFSASGRGEGLFISHPRMSSYRVQLAECFWTPQGGLDVFVLCHENIMRPHLDGRAPSSRTDSADRLLKMVLELLRARNADQARFSVPRAERFAASLDGFVRFGSQAQALVQQHAERDIRQGLSQKKDVAGRFRRLSYDAQLLSIGLPY